jgi:hypothetical protein
MSDKNSGVFCTSFCNHPHRLNDGKPIGHECFVLPTAMLHYERVGDSAKAREAQALWKHRSTHKGVRAKPRR